MKKIGITGSIASGKTTASKILSKGKGPLFSADDEVKRLYKRKKFNKISFIYIDCNVFKVVDMILNELSHKISKGGVIAFDEARNKFNKDEGKAMMKFYMKNKKNYKLLRLNANYQPDAILIKK